MSSKNFVPVVYKAGFTTGTTVTTSSVSAAISIPLDANGTTARHLMLSATAACHINLSNSTGTSATAGDLMVQAGDRLCLDSRGATAISYIQDSASGKLNIAPLEA